MLRITIYLVALLINAVESNKGEWPCSKSDATQAFKKKTIVNPWPHFAMDPYDNKTEALSKIIQDALSDKVRVCAIKYVDQTKSKYETEDFSSKDQAEKAGYIVTHQGNCGACSTLQDLAVYLETNLTKPVRSCGMRSVISKDWTWECIKRIGFSDRCTDIWMFNSLNTRKECFAICLWAWITRQPNNNPDGTLNKCLQCDEDKSGPVFKYFSGRTRRNSGIDSEIKRPGEEVYEMDHCYF